MSGQGPGSPRRRGGRRPPAPSSTAQLAPSASRISCPRRSLPGSLRLQTSWSDRVDVCALAEAAVQLLGAAAAEAHYWIVNEEVPFPRRGYPWDAERRSRFVDVVAGIERGVFPAIPGEWDSWATPSGTANTAWPS
jgi:hypothetical protein